jgi:hypothetical protein
MDCGGQVGFFEASQINVRKNMSRILFLLIMKPFSKKRNFRSKKNSGEKK